MSAPTPSEAVRLDAVDRDILRVALTSFSKDPRRNLRARERAIELRAVLASPTTPTEEQLDAEIRAEGGDPDDYARRGAAAIDGAIKQAALLNAMAAAKRGATCPMCGRASPHEHSPEEIVIFGNGRKYESAARGIDSGEAGETRQGLDHEVARARPEGARPRESEIAQPSPHIEPETEQAAYEAWCPYRGSPDPRVVWAAAWKAAKATTPTEGPAQAPDERDSSIAAMVGVWDGKRYVYTRDAIPGGGPALLTDEEIEELWSAWLCGPSDAISTFARAIESKVRASTLTDPEGAS